MVLARFALAEGFFTQARTESELFLSKAAETTAQVTGAPSPLRKSSCCTAPGDTEQLLGPSTTTCWALLGGQDAVVLNYFGPGAHQLCWLQRERETRQLRGLSRIINCIGQGAFGRQRWAIWELWEKHFPLGCPQGQEGWRKGQMVCFCLDIQSWL